MVQPLRKYCLFVREDLAFLKEDFFEAKELAGMKSDTYMYKALRDFLAEKGIDLNTQSNNLPEDSEVIICLNETSFFTHYKRQKKNRLLILILTEPPVYNSIDWKETRHASFDKILSYDSDLLKRNSAKYIHINFPIDFSQANRALFPNVSSFQNKKLSCLIAGAIAITKGPPEAKSLLHERYRILNWYNKHKPLSLDFYSRTSPIQKFEYFRGASILNKYFPSLRETITGYLYKKNISAVYKGSIPSLQKNEIMGTYKFSYCLENSHSIKGLISEKIFDCFMSQTIPIYLGAPDIETYIPKKCFVAYSDFNSIEELHHFIEQMDYHTYLSYLEHAKRFLENAEQIFSSQTFVEKIYNICEK